MEPSRLKRKSMLFAFQSRPGEECSSDSEDSDYYPGRESENEDDEVVQRTRKNHARCRKRAKKEVSGTPVRRKTRKNTQNGVDPSSESHQDGAQLNLPPEVMVRIFRFGIGAVGAINFIPRVAQVCKAWNRIASDSSMFEHLDLSTGHILLTKKNLASLKRFLKHDISQCRHLSLFGQVEIGSSTIEHILNLTPRLRSLNLHGCVVKPEIIKLMPQLCPQIQRVDLTSLGENYRKSTLASVEALIKGLGAGLVELRMCNSSAVLQNPCQVLKIIEENCPNLEELDLGVERLITNRSLTCKADMVGLATGCPQLRELHLDGFNILDSTLTQEPYKNGFKHLQVYSQSTHIHYHRELPAFYRLFGSVTKLRMLNVSYSRLLPSRISQWVREVEELYLKDMRWTESEETDMIQCVAAWHMSLQTLDLSSNRPCGMVIDAALSQFGNPVDPHEHPLQVLNLSNSNVTARGVIHVIGACKNLKEINLTSCRELPRGTKREFKSKEFSSLLKSLRPFVQESDDGCEDDSVTSDSE